MSSSDWIAKAALDGGPATDAKLRAIASYGRCYDERTDRLAAALTRARKGPSRTALAEFRDFESSIKNFTATALATADSPPDTLKSAYAALYARQFRYAFYQSFEPKTAKPRPHPTTGVSASRSAAVPAPKPAQAPSVPASAASAPRAAAQAPADQDPLTVAKNHFGELLDALPDDKMREIHAAFGKVVGRFVVTNETRLAVYRYAIFLLESPSAEPFSPPPF